MNKQNPYEIAYEREKKARKLAEDLLDDKTRELYENVLHLETVVVELNTTQAQLVQSEKMASIGQLTAGMAHEINNPIGFSSSNISSLYDYLVDLFLLDDLIGTSENQQVDDHELLKNYRQLHHDINANFIKQDIPNLIKDTLQGLHRVSSIVANLKKISYKGNDEFTYFSINECIEDCLKAVKNDLKYSMTIELELNHCPNVFGKASDLHQVFINLFINASHACKENGKLSIKSYQEKNGVVVIVQDNGQGIASENIKKIYDPFYTTKNIGEGTGLGLYISHGIIEKHHGKIQVDSIENQGTRFTITLPIDSRNVIVNQALHNT